MVKIVLSSHNVAASAFVETNGSQTGETISLGFLDPLKADPD